jgi:spermidine synthase
VKLRFSAIALMIASGFAGLGYQLVWTQQSALWLGHEAAAMLAIVAAFFGGLGLGALLLGRRIDASARPARWYAACEAVIGGWGLVLIVFMAPASSVMQMWLGAAPPAWLHWTVAFGGTFLLLLPATFAMGATLPAMERILGAARAHRAPVALLYAANTFGAVLGVLGAAFVLIPWVGMKLTAAVCVALNLACAAVAMRLCEEDAAVALRLREEDAPAREPPRVGPAPLATLAFTGLLGIGYEVLVVRALSQVAENTLYTFAILLAVYLIGTALGAAAYARWDGGPRSSRNALLRWQTLACLAGVASLSVAAPMKHALLGALGGGMGAALVAESALACVAFLLPTIVMGALFSHLVTAARAAGVSFGRAIGANTLAAAAAPIVFGVWLLPALGTSWALLLVCVGYLIASTEWRARAQWATAATALAMLVWHPPLATVTLPEGGRVLTQAEGVSANVSVIEDAAGFATLHINNRQQEGSSVTRYSDARQALLPLLLHPAPRRVLFLGLGTGATARSAAIDPALHVDAVELLPEVISASALFARLQQVASPPSLQIWNADARRFVRAAGESYDVIIADNFHPARSGSAALYTREHFAAVRARLGEQGVFCQWLPLHQLDLDTARSIIATYLTEFPQTWAVLATHSLDTPVLGLVARRDGGRLELAQVRAMLASHDAPAREVDLGDELALLGSFIAGPASLVEFSAGAPLNTDDHPIVAYLAPRITYKPSSTPRERLLALLGQVHVEPGELFDAARDPDRSQRLAAYWNARNRYLQVGSSVRPSADVHVMLAQVREPLLGVLEASPDFRPAYDPLVSMARALGRTDPREARTLLSALATLHPDWHEADDALAELAPVQ